MDTLHDLETTRRFEESYGSYPVLRVQDWSGKDIGDRIDTNPTGGQVPVETVLKQLANAQKKLPK